MGELNPSEEAAVLSGEADPLSGEGTEWVMWCEALRGAVLPDPVLADVWAGLSLVLIGPKLCIFLSEINQNWPECPAHSNSRSD